MKLNSMLRNTKVQIGLRLFFASLFVVLGNYVLAAIVMLFPAFQFNPFILATGAGDPEGQEKALLDKITKGVEKIVAEATKENVNKETLDKAIEKLNKDIAKLSNEGMAELNKRVTAIGEANDTLKTELKAANDALIVQSAEIKKLTEKGGVEEAAKPISFRKAIENAILEKKDLVLTEKNDDNGKRLSLKDYFTEKGNKTTPVFTIKAAVDMFETNIVGNNVATVRLTELDPQRVGIPLTIYPHVLDVFKSKTIRRPTMSLLVVHTYFDGSATKVEGAASGKSSFLLKTVEFKAFYLATHFVLSDETLDDLSEAMDEIAIVAPDKIMDLIDSKVLGSTGDDVTDIAGILTANKMTAFSAAAGLGANTVEAAYLPDAIASAKLQCEKNKYKPALVYLNPTEVALLAASKNTFDDSKTDRRVQYDLLGNPVAVCGLRIIQSTAIVAGTFIVIDPMQPWIGKRADMTMEIGYNGTDLTEGQKTVVLKVRLAFGVRDKAGVIYCSDITAALAALETA